MAGFGGDAASLAHLPPSRPSHLPPSRPSHLPPSPPPLPPAPFPLLRAVGFKGILLFGTPEQKLKYLPDLAAGKKVAAFALTEPSMGSDAKAVRARATRAADGSWRLSGGKLWISNGGQADVFTVFAQTEVAPGRDEMTAFIVERGFGGVTNGPPEKKMGIRCSNTSEVFFDATPVPAGNVIGEVGGGFKVAMEILNNGRFGMGATLTGTMKAVLQGATEHARTRVQFGKTIREYESVQNKLATMASRLYATESLAYMLAANMDRGMTDYQIEAAISKVYASESAWFVADEGIQILGGLGFMRALPFERIQRDLRIFRIFEGTNDVLRIMIAGAGLGAAGKRLEPVGRALKSPLTSLPVLLPFAVSSARSRLGLLETPSLAWAPPRLRPAAAAIEEGTAAFGDACQGLLLRHGGGGGGGKAALLEQQVLLEKVADVAIDLTVATAALARAARALEDKAASAEHEADLATIVALDAQTRVRANVAAVRGEGAGEKGLRALKRTVAHAVCENGGYKTRHPTGV